VELGLTWLLIAVLDLVIYIFSNGMFKDSVEKKTLSNEVHKIEWLILKNKEFLVKVSVNIL